MTDRNERELLFHVRASGITVSRLGETALVRLDWDDLAVLLEAVRRKHPAMRDTIVS